MKGENYEYVELYFDRRRRRHYCRGINIEKNEIVKPAKHLQ